ncbi:MAG: ribbon-helix-helix protein, CopG family [Halobacteriota archaeon]
MGNKDTTLTFRVTEDTAEALRHIADARDLPLSAVFRDYANALVSHDGRVAVVPEHQVDDASVDDSDFPPTVEVPTSFVREHERLELENDHLRQQLEEYKSYVTQLIEELEAHEADDEGDVIDLEELDRELDIDPDRRSYKLG